MAAAPAAPAASVTKLVARPLADRGARLFAVVADSALVAIPVTVGLLVARPSSDAPGPTAAYHQLWLVAAAALVILQWMLLSLRGQTLGKIAMGVRSVLADDGSNPGFLRAVVLRSFVPSLLRAVPVREPCSPWLMSSSSAGTKPLYPRPHRRHQGCGSVALARFRLRAEAGS